MPPFSYVYRGIWSSSISNYTKNNIVIDSGGFYFVCISSSNPVAGVVPANRPEIWQRLNTPQSYYAGQWNDITYYNPFDTVLDTTGTKLYMYIYSEVNGVFYDTNNSTYWALISTKSTAVYSSIFDSKKAYFPNNIVLFTDGLLYSCTSPVIYSVFPSTGSTNSNWEPITLRFRSGLYNVYNNLSDGYTNGDIVIWDDAKLYCKTDATKYGLYPGVTDSGWSLFSNDSLATLQSNYSVLTQGKISLYASNSPIVPINLYYYFGTSRTLINNASPKYYGVSSRITTIYYTKGDIVLDPAANPYRCNTNLTKWVDNTDTINWTSVAGLALSTVNSGTYTPGTYTSLVCVIYNNAYYINFTESSTTEPPSNIAYWTQINEYSAWKYLSAHSQYTPYSINSIVFYTTDSKLYIATTNNFINSSPSIAGWSQITPTFRGTFYSIYNNISGAYANYDVVLYEDGYFYIKVDDTKYGLTPPTDESGWVRFLKQAYNDFPTISPTDSDASGDFWLDTTGYIILKYYNGTSSFSLTNKTPKFYGENSIVRTYYNTGDVVVSVGTYIYTIVENFSNNPYDDTKFTNQRLPDFSGNFISGTNYKPHNIVHYDGIYYADISGYSSGTAVANDLSNSTIWTQLSNTRTQAYQGYVDPLNAYIPGDYVFDGAFNECLKAAYINNFPSSDLTKWLPFSPRYCGTFDSDGSYSKYDIVLNSGKYYISLSNLNTADTTDSSFWNLFIISEVDSVWNSATTYSTGQIVSFSSTTKAARLLYVCKGYSNSSPTYDTANWNVLDVKLGPAYVGLKGQVGKVYNIGDIVIDGTNIQIVEGPSKTYTTISLRFRSSLYNIYNDMSGGYLFGDIVIWDDGKLYCKTDNTIYGLAPDMPGSGWRLFNNSVVTDLSGNWSSTTTGTFSLYASTKYVPIDMYYYAGGGHIKISNASPKFYSGFISDNLNRYYTVGDFAAAESTAPMINLSNNLAKYNDVNFTPLLDGKNLKLIAGGYRNSSTYKQYDCVFDTSTEAFYIDISGAPTIIGVPLTNINTWTQMSFSNTWAYLGFYSYTYPYNENSVILFYNGSYATTKMYISTGPCFINEVPGNLEYNWLEINPVFCGLFSSLNNDISGGYSMYDIVLFTDGYFYFKSDPTLVGLDPNVSGSGWLVFLKNDYTSLLFSSTTVYQSGNIIVNTTGNSLQLYYLKYGVTYNAGVWASVSSNFTPFQKKSIIYYGAWSDKSIYNTNDLVLTSGGNMYKCLDMLVTGIEPSTDSAKWSRDVSGYAWRGISTWTAGTSYTTKKIVYTNYNYYINVATGSNSTDPLFVSSVSSVSSGWTIMTNNNTDLDKYELYKGLWNSTTPNIIGDIVYYQGNFFRCNISNFIVVPGSDAGVTWSPINLVFNGQGSANADFAGGPYSSTVASNGALATYAVSWWPAYTTGGYEPSLWIQTDPTGSSDGWWVFTSYPSLPIDNLTSWNVATNYNAGDAVVDMSGGCNLYISPDNDNIGNQPYLNYGTLWIPVTNDQARIRNLWSSDKIYTLNDIVMDTDLKYYILNQSYAKGPINADQWTNIDLEMNYKGWIPTVDKQTSSLTYTPYSIVFGKYGFLYIAVPGLSTFLPLVNSFVNPVILASDSELISPGELVLYRYSFLYKNNSLIPVTIDSAVQIPPLTANYNAVMRGAFSNLCNDIPGYYNQFDVVLYTDAYFYIKSDNTKHGLLPTVSESGWTEFDSRLYTIMSPIIDRPYSLHDIVLVESDTKQPQLYGYVSVDPVDGLWQDISDSFAPISMNLVIYYGAHSSTTIYNYGDLVLVPGGKMYKSLQNSVLDINPLSDDAAPYWSLVTTGYAWNFRGIWAPGSYTNNQIVFTNNNYYINVSGSANTTNPETGTGWTIMSNNNTTIYNRYRGVWVSTTPNIIGDIVSHAGKYWICKSLHFIGEPGVLQNADWAPLTGDTSLTNYVVSTLGLIKSGKAFNASIRGLVFDTKGYMYACADLSNNILKISQKGSTTIFAGNGTQGRVNGAGLLASFNNPVGLAIDSQDNLYVSDRNNHIIRKIGTNGTVTTFAGSSKGYGDGTGTAALFNSPTGLVCDSAGNLYVCDTGNAVIRKITSNGVVTTLAGMASNTGYTDGTGVNAMFMDPEGIVIDSNNILYITDKSNNVVRRVTSTGVVTTLVGSINGHADLVGPAAKFDKPSGIVMDLSGNIYVGDKCCIRKITNDVIVSTIAGLYNTSGNVDGNGSTARFGSAIYGLAISSDGNIFIADYNNSSIRVIKSESDSGVEPMPVCLLMGTKVNTPNGWVSIENIAVGDSVYNHLMKPVKIVKTHRWNIDWGSKIFGETVYKIPSGTFGATQDIYISAYHKVLINDEEMIEAFQIGLRRALKSEIAPNGVYTLCHIQMEDHYINNFIIEGACIVESWDGRLSMSSVDTCVATKISGQSDLLEDIEGVN
jgi:hypothetical protein